MFTIIQSDITKMKNVDVIVNAANGVGVMGKGVAGAIAKSGGSLLTQAAKKAYQDNGKPFDTGDIYITDAGLLKRIGVKYIYHAVVMKYPGSPTSIYTVAKTCKHVIKTAVLNNVASIAFPGLGTGIGGLDKRVVASHMVSILKPYSDQMDIFITDSDGDFIHWVNRWFGGVDSSLNNSV